MEKQKAAVMKVLVFLFMLLQLTNIVSHTHTQDWFSHSLTFGQYHPCIIPLRKPSSLFSQADTVGFA